MRGNAAAAQTTSFIFFALVFLAPTFLLRDQLAEWLQTVAAANPTTCALDAMRGLLIDGWDASAIVPGVAVVAGLCLLTLGWATSVARGVIARQ